MRYAQPTILQISNFKFSKFETVKRAVIEAIKLLDVGARLPEPHSRCLIGLFPTEARPRNVPMKENTPKVRESTRTTSDDDTTYSIVVYRRRTVEVRWIP